MEFQQLGDLGGGTAQLGVSEGGEEVVEQQTVHRGGLGGVQSCRLPRVPWGLVSPGRDSDVRPEEPSEFLPDFYEESAVGSVSSKVVSLLPGVHGEVHQLLILAHSLVTDVTYGGSGYKYFNFFERKYF